MVRCLLLGAAAVLLVGCASPPRTAEEMAANKAERAKLAESCRSLALGSSDNVIYWQCYRAGLLTRGL